MLNTYLIVLQLECDLNTVETSTSASQQDSGDVTYQLGGDAPSLNSSSTGYRELRRRRDTETETVCTYYPAVSRLKGGDAISLNSSATGLYRIVNKSYNVRKIEPICRCQKIRKMQIVFIKLCAVTSIRMCN